LAAIYCEIYGKILTCPKCGTKILELDLGLDVTPLGIAASWLSACILLIWVYSTSLDEISKIHSPPQIKGAEMSIPT
jgi:hypothetical protein